jgi:adenylate cyclase class 2
LGMPSHEVEIKFRVADIEALSSRLRELGLQQVTPRTHEMNVLFDLPGRPLRARGEILRLRKYGETWVLTHKGRSEDQGGPHKKRVETETRVENGEKMEAILRELQFESSFRYEKFRAEWKGSEGHVVVDETPIGNLGEIEGPAHWIDSMASQLGIDRKHYITDTYAALFAAWKKETGSDATEMTFAAVSRTDKR